MKVKSPIQSLSHNIQLRLFTVFAIMTLLLLVIISYTGSPLNTEAAPMGIVSFELAGSGSRTEAILSSWDWNAKLHAAFSLGLDFLFIPAYVAAFSLGCSLSSWSVRSRSWPLAGTGNLLVWGVILAGLLDVIENASLLVILLGKVTSLWSRLASLCAGIKFGLLFLALVYILYGGIVSLVIRERAER